MTSESKYGVHGTIRVDDKMLRLGYTTGTCAAGAAGAALYALIRREEPEEVRVTLPEGETIYLEVHDCVISEDVASCAIIKDGGDDPDITDGLRIYASVSIDPKETGVRIQGGAGVGKVTLPGLQIEPGEWAINPVPRRMIRESIQATLRELGLNEEMGVRVTISAPGGEELAAKTFNPRLGIEGGLSILGTTGIVRPMSEDALKKSLALTLRMALDPEENPPLVFTPGNYGSRFAKSLGIRDDISVSNYLGDMIDEAKMNGVNRILLVGEIGKLVKVAGGIFQTHSKVADARMEIMAANLAELGAPQSLIREILEQPTTLAADDLIRKAGMDAVFDVLARKIRARCEERSNGEIEFAVVLFERVAGLLAKTENAKDMITERIAYEAREQKQAEKTGGESENHTGPGEEENHA